MPAEGWLPSSDNDDGGDDDHVCGQEEVRRTQADAATHNGCGQLDVANLPEPTIADNGRWHNVWAFNLLLLPPGGQLNKWKFQDFLFPKNEWVIMKWMYKKCLICAAFQYESCVRLSLDRNVSYEQVWLFSTYSAAENMGECLLSNIFFFLISIA